MPAGESLLLGLMHRGQAVGVGYEPKAGASGGGGGPAWEEAAARRRQPAGGGLAGAGGDRAPIPRLGV